LLLARAFVERVRSLGRVVWGVRLSESFGSERSSERSERRERTIERNARSEPIAWAHRHHLRHTSTA